MQECMITIGLVVHNEEKNIVEFLNQLKETSGKTFCELIIVDNASSDSTRNMILSWIQNQPNFSARLISHEINHMAHARNSVLNEARGEWVYFIDADCRLGHSFLACFSKGVMPIMAQPNIAAIGGGNVVATDSYWLDRRLAEMSRIWLGHMGSIQLVAPEAVRPVSLLSTCNLFVKKAAALECGGFDLSFEFIGEDMSLCHRLRRRGFELVAVPGIEVLHLQRMGVLAWCKKMLGYGEAQVRVALKYPGHFCGVRGVQFFLVALAALLLVFQPLLILSCFGIYVGILGISSFGVLKDFKRTLAATLFITLSHSFYAAGELWGAVTCFRFLNSASRPQKILNLEQQ